MAKYKQMNGLESDSVAAERADVIDQTRGLGMKTISVERVNYGDRAVEIPLVEVDHARLGRPVDKQYEHNLNMVLGRLRDIGVQTATVINFRPETLITSSCLEVLRKTKVRPARDGEEFGFTIFSHVCIEPARMGADAPKIAIDHHPITLAKTFVSEYEPLGGGVFAFVGLPDDVKNPNWVHREAFEHARQQAIERMNSEVKEAMSFWNTRDHREAYRIADHHRASARRLYHLGYFKVMPEFVDKQRDLAVKVPTCPKCQRPSEPNSAVCTNDNCNYIIDPKRAFEIGDIDENHSALERLTRKEVEEMGIGDYVAECADEKVERLKAKLPKPLSKVAMEQIRQQQEWEEEDRRKNAALVASMQNEQASGKAKRASAGE